MFKGGKKEEYKLNEKMLTSPDPEGNDFIMSAESPILNPVISNIVCSMSSIYYSTSSIYTHS